MLVFALEFYLVSLITILLKEFEYGLFYVRCSSVADPLNMKTVFDYTEFNVLRGSDRNPM